MLHCLLYWPCRSRTRRLRSGWEWESAASALWLALRCALTAITPTLRMVARPMATTGLAGSLVASLSALAPGTTAGDIHIMAGPMLAALRVVVRLGAASLHAVRSQARAAGSTVGDLAAVANS